MHAPHSLAVAAAMAPVADPMVAVGVITAPGAHSARTAARKTWMEGLSASDMVVRFVIGRHHARCNSSLLAEEMAEHNDFALVDCADCRMWFSQEKVHRWYEWALVTWPRTSWYAKMEDDGLLWPPATQTF